MLKATVKNLLARAGWSLHRKDSIDRLIRELDRARNAAPSSTLGGTEPPLTTPYGASSNGTDGRLWKEYQDVRHALDWYETRKSSFVTTEDYGSLDKQKRLIDHLEQFGNCDFADLAGWIFASSLSNHRVIHQRIDEGASLWRAVKMSGGPILEIGRAAGGSTITILGASDNRAVVSIDRAPFHSNISDRIFNRADVKHRLKLYTQSSREAIPETEFGMMFIDGDHSYEGVCHDIAMFWNSLKPFDGKPAIAAFHDAAKNPITYVEPVKRACDELIAEPGAARVIETWGAMLVLEKLGDIDQDRWFAKEDRHFSRKYPDNRGRPLAPTQIRGVFRSDKRPGMRGPHNFLGEDNLDNAAWQKIGVELDRVFDEVDNPVRFVKETPQFGRHGIRKTAALGVESFALTVFIRPVRSSRIQLSISDENDQPLTQIEFDLANVSQIHNPRTWRGAEICDAAFLYGNGFFRCELGTAAGRRVPSVTVAVNTLGADEKIEHHGASERGFLMNLASLREIRACE